MNTIRSVWRIYRQIPEVPCIPGCKGCCVSPNMTLAEFIILVDFIINRIPSDTVHRLFTRPTAAHPSFEGNNFCRFQGENGFCLIHEGRAMACRLHGLPAIEQLGVSNLENCTIMDRARLPVLSNSEIKSWLNQLMAINKSLLADYGESFYQIVGLNVECWLDIFFQKNASNERLRKLHEICRQFIPIENLDFPYTSQTNIEEKLEKISLLEICIKMGEANSAKRILKTILKGFPSTGNYFHDTAAWMLNKIEGTSSPEKTS